jgi:hypothetical protein
MPFINPPSTTFTDLGRATEAFNLAKTHLLEDLETVELVETAPGRWVVAFYDIEDGSLACLL